jgi:hypothetical protein
MIRANEHGQYRWLGKATLCICVVSVNQVTVEATARELE